MCESWPMRLYLPVRPAWSNAAASAVAARPSSVAFDAVASPKADIEVLIHTLGVLVVDDNQFMRKIVRNLLLNIGVREDL